MLTHTESGTTGTLAIGQPTGIDPSALEAHRRVLLNFALMKLRNPAQAEDVVQETLLAALGSRPGFSGRSSLCTWLIGILKHKIIDLQRAMGREIARAQSLSGCDPEDEDSVESAFDDATAAPAEWANPEQLLARKRFIEELERAMQHLPEKSARAFLLYEVGGLGVREISGELAVSVNHCCVMLHRARTALRERLFGDQFEAFGLVH